MYCKNVLLPVFLQVDLQLRVVDSNLRKQKHKETDVAIPIELNEAVQFDFKLHTDNAEQISKAMVSFIFCQIWKLCQI